MRCYAHLCPTRRHFQHPDHFALTNVTDLLLLNPLKRSTADRQGSRKENRIKMVQLDGSPTHLFRRILQCAGEVFAAEPSDANLTPRQAAVLVTVSRNEGLSQTGVVERTAIDRSTLADIVKRLQRKGLLQRRRTRKDRRAYAVSLTDEGRRVLRRAELLMASVDERVLRVLPTRDREKFIGYLKAIRGRLESETRIP